MLLYYVTPMSWWRCDKQRSVCSGEEDFIRYCGCRNPSYDDIMMFKEILTV